MLYIYIYIVFILLEIINEENDKGKNKKCFVKARTKHDFKEEEFFNIGTRIVKYNDKLGGSGRGIEDG